MSPALNPAVGLPLFASWAIQALIASTLLMALVMALRAPARRLFGPQLAYALWALPLLRLLLPPLPESWRQVAATPLARASDTISVIMIDPVGGAAAAAPSVAVSHLPSLGATLGTLWLVGGLGFLCWHFAAHNRFCRRLLGSAARIERVNGVSIIASEVATGPLAFGVVRRYVAFPLDFDDRYDADERELALAHELGHHQRGDLIANWAALAVLAVHWFNPIAWRAFRAFRADQELANDARVLSGRSTIDRHAYACAIIKAAHGGAVSAACHLHTIDDLKGRIRMLSTLPRSRRSLMTGGAIISVLVMSGLGITASGTSAAAALTGTVGETMGVDLQMPAAPRVPAAPATASARAAPDAPAAPAAPVAPDAVASSAPAGSGGHPPVTTTSRTITIADDKITMTDGPVTAKDGTPVWMANIPQVRSQTCKGHGGDDEPYVIQTSANGHKAMIICSDRIARAAAAAGVQAAAAAAKASVAAQHATAIAIDDRAIQRTAMTAALSGLVSARVIIAGNRDMSADQRREALAGIDENLAEMRQELGKGD